MYVITKAHHRRHMLDTVKSKFEPWVLDQFNFQTARPSHNDNTFLIGDQSKAIHIHDQFMFNIFIYM